MLSAFILHKLILPYAHVPVPICQYIVEYSRSVYISGLKATSERVYKRKRDLENDERLSKWIKKIDQAAAEGYNAVAIRAVNYNTDITTQSVVAVLKRAGLECNPLNDNEYEVSWRL